MPCRATISPPLPGPRAPATARSATKLVSASASQPQSCPFCRAALAASRRRPSAAVAPASTRRCYSNYLGLCSINARFSCSLSPWPRPATALYYFRCAPPHAAVAGSSPFQVTAASHKRPSTGSTLSAQRLKSQYKTSWTDSSGHFMFAVQINQVCVSRHPCSLIYINPPEPR